MPTRTRAAQLDRDIADVLRGRGSHHATRPPDDGWLVARDAILEHDPDRASDIVNEIREVPDHPKPSRAFKKALHDAPSSVRARFEQRVPGWESKLGKPEFQETAPGQLTLYVPEHGQFSASLTAYNRWRARSRRTLLNLILQIYEGSSAHGGKGEKAAHWRGYDKNYLAMIVADAFGDQ
jgi:hypothetical protein